MTAETSLLHRLQQYDVTAWTQVVAEWTPDLYHYLCYTLPTPTAAEAVAGETFQAFVQATPTFTEQLSLRTYLYIAVYRKVADYWRRPPVAGVWSAGEQRFPLLGLPGELKEPLAELPELAQQVLMLRYQAGLSLLEIAEVLGRSRKATESLFNRLLHQFSATLDSQGQQFSDEELFDLFQRKVPRLLLPSAFVERLQQQVLSQLQSRRE
ncbi:MAG: sigma-70 family RNA polymerase sigma factor [Caldilinea sp. CFX5]|nr:sigma-70 family RNA polymerase sigma factor [Caldilinea sp. CFX5]